MPGRGQAPPAGGSAPDGLCSQPVPVDFITRLGIQYLYSGVPIFTACQSHSADLDESGSARFRVYALTDDPRYCANITSELSRPVSRYSLGKLRVRLHPTTLLSTLRHRFRLVGEGRDTYAEYTPEIRWGPRTDDIQFSFTTLHPHTTRFLAHFDLTVPGAVTRLGSP